MPARIRSTIGDAITAPENEVSRDDLRAGNLVFLQAISSATTYAWNITFRPEGSTAAFSGDVTTQFPGSFTVDEPGPYQIRLIVDLGLPTEDHQYVRLRYLTVLGDLKLVSAGEAITTTGKIPVDLETTGWAHEQNFNINRLLALIQPIVSSGRVLYVDPNATGGTATPDPVTGLVEGYADYAVIQEAITEAVAQGADPDLPWVVLVRPGHYTEDLTFAPHVHVMGWPGNPQDISNTVQITTNTGFHSAVMAGVGDSVILSGLTLDNAGFTVEPVLRKTGSGAIFVHRCVIVQRGLAGTQGPAVGVVDGSAVFDHCALTFRPTTSAGLFAFAQVSPSTATFRGCQLTGPSGVNLNPFGFGLGVVTTFIDCDITATIIAGNAVQAAGEIVVLDYCRIRAPLGVPLNVNPAALALAAVDVTVRWSSLDGDISYENAGIIPGQDTLHIGSVEYESLNFPTGIPTITASVKSRSLFYDATASGLAADNVQDAIDEVAALSVLITTLDDAYDGGIPLSGTGRRIVADADPVEIVGAAVPTDPVPANINDGKLRVVGGVEVGAITKPEIDVSPNPFGNGPVVKMGWTVWATGASFGSSATVMARSTGTPLFRDYNLRLQTESSEGGGEIGRLIVRGGDAISNGGGTPDASSVYIQAGSAFDAAAGEAGDLYLAPGVSQFGATGSLLLVRPEAATSATVTAAGVFVGGVSGDAIFATNMGAVTVSILAGDVLATVQAKFDATGHITAAGDPIVLTTVAQGPNAEVYLLSADAGINAALGGFAGQSMVQGTWPEFMRIQAVGGNEISFGDGGATGPMLYNSDTGKLTVPGVIDPTAVIYDEAAPINAGAAKGVTFVGDGTGGSIQGNFYYRHESGALQDITAAVGAASVPSTFANARDVTVAPNSTLDLYGWADRQAKLIKVEAFCTTVATVGAYTLAVAKDPNGTADNMLSAATFDLTTSGTLSAFVPTDVPLTSTAADLILDVGDVWRVRFVSDNAGLDAEGVYFQLTWLVL